MSSNPRKLPRAKAWPNGLGWDVGEHEILRHPDGTLSVRIFEGGEVVRYWRAPAGTDPRRAVEAALREGADVRDPADLSNAARYRARGYRVVFRSARVYLLPPGTPVWFSTPVRGGAWLGTTPLLDPDRWLPVIRECLPFEPDALARVCYCRSLPGGNCDFCADVRRVPGEEVTR